MKSTGFKYTGLVAGLATCTLFAALSSQAATPVSPVGTVWDCIISGSRQEGIAFLTFADDKTFSGYQLLSTRVRKPKSSEDRSSYPDADRDGLVDPPSSSSHTNVFGFCQVTGPWRYDANGKVIGSYALVVGADENEENGTTNSISFTAKVSAGKSISLVAKTKAGQVVYSGKPYKATRDFGGEWYATKIRGKQELVEFFDMISFASDNPWGERYPDLGSYPGIYFSQEGQGAGYSTAGFAMLSSRKKAGFAFQSTPWGDTNSVLSATFGSYSVSKSGTVKASTVGVEDPMTGVTFKAVLVPAP